MITPRDHRLLRADLDTRILCREPLQQSESCMYQTVIACDFVQLLASRAMT